MENRAVVGGYGARLGVEASDERLLGDLIADLPPGWAVLEGGSHDTAWRFSACREGRQIRTTVEHGGPAGLWDDPQQARRALAQELRRYVGFHTPDLVFIHAGVVAYREQAIVLPGASHAGKSTLAEALVRAGAVFYSDEYAVLRRDGLVVQYREPLITRGPDGRRAGALAAAGPDQPLRVGLVGVVSYRRGATWRPRRLTSADGVLKVLEHTIAAPFRPEQTLSTLKLAFVHATVLAGDRGEADVAANALLRTASGLWGSSARSS